MLVRTSENDICMQKLNRFLCARYDIVKKLLQTTLESYNKFCTGFYVRVFNYPIQIIIHYTEQDLAGLEKNIKEMIYAHVFHTTTYLY